MYAKTITAKHPYEDRITEYILEGVQRFNGEEFPLYTADNGNGTTVSLETIIERDKNVLLRLDEI